MDTQEMNEQLAKSLPKQTSVKSQTASQKELTQKLDAVKSPESTNKDVE